MVYVGKLLVSLRKLFIVLNAAIGVYTVFNITGFSLDNWYAGVYGIGYSYFEIFTNAVSRLFHWFMNFLDYKVVPNVPDLPDLPDLPSNPNVKSQPQDLSKLININYAANDWNIPSWLWYAGLAVVTVGGIYLCYSLVTSPEFLDWLTPDTKGKGRAFSPDLSEGSPTEGNALPFSRTSSQDTIAAFDDSVLQTPRTRIWQLSNPTIMGNVNTTHFNHNPVNPNTLLNEHFRELRFAAGQEAIIDNIVNNNNPF